MGFEPGTSIGNYEITAAIGKGGMGEVYRARDRQLKRDVAIKSLPAEFSGDAGRLARFQREAEALASLNHPHIGAIYGLEESGGSRFLVLELIDGETLAGRLQRGPIPVEEALPMAAQIAEALEAAHERGIIHRDLKPGNVMVLPDGTVKVLDFGLSKAVNTLPAGSLSDSPTLGMAATGAGVILGTAAYMSPEQAKGKEADRAADSWSFGCVLYEMLTGRPAFDGETAGEILASVLKSEPDWNCLPPAIPDGVRRVLRRCLEKDARRRLRDLRDARIELDEAQRMPEAGPRPITAGHRRLERLGWISIIAILGAIAAVAAARALRPAPAAPELRLEINTPPTTDPVSLAISPDGLKVAFVAVSNDQPLLWLRPLASVTAQPLEGTGGAQYPFWSPDGRSVGFFSEGKLKRIDVDTGVVQTLANAPQGRGGTWNQEGVILFTPGASSSIFRISSTGGEPVAVTGTDEPCRFPEFLPDGRHFICYVRISGTRGVYLGQLDEPHLRRLVDADGAAAYAQPGYLLFVRQGTLFALPFDPVGFEPDGELLPLAAQVTVDITVQRAALSVSPAGPIVYRSDSGAGERQFIWFDRSGRQLEAAGEFDSSGPLGPALSPDGRRAALHRNVDGNVDIWIYDLIRGVFRRFTFDAANDVFPLWSPDGSRIAFASDRTGVMDLYWKAAAGEANEELLLATEQPKRAADWSSDGRFLLYVTTDTQTANDLWVLPLEGDSQPFPAVRTNFEERWGQFSPDGKWIAYESNESGRFEIYIQPLYGPAGKWLASTAGGVHARWRSDGRELFYLALDGRLMSVPVRLLADAVETGAPVPLFTTRLGYAIQNNFRQAYMVSAGGERFLMHVPAREAASPITVILNWNPKP